MTSVFIWFSLNHFAFLLKGIFLEKKRKNFLILKVLGKIEITVSKLPRMVFRIYLFVVYLSLEAFEAVSSGMKHSFYLTDKLHTQILILKQGATNSDIHPIIIQYSLVEELRT